MPVRLTATQTEPLIADWISLSGLLHITTRVHGFICYGFVIICKLALQKQRSSDVFKGKGRRGHRVKPSVRSSWQKCQIDYTLMFSGSSYMYKMHTRITLKCIYAHRIVVLVVFLSFFNFLNLFCVSVGAFTLIPNGCCTSAVCFITDCTLLLVWNC